MQLDTVGDLQFYHNKNCDFRIVELVKSINRFGYGGNSTGNSFGDGFKHIYSIDSLYLESIILNYHPLKISFQIHF
jgi:hypothetical protein